MGILKKDPETLKEQIDKLKTMSKSQFTSGLLFKDSRSSFSSAVSNLEVL